MAMALGEGDPVDGGEYWVRVSVRERRQRKGEHEEDSVF